MGVTTGEVLAGRYELGERLGRGGMGVVYAARDRHLARPVAVKVLDEAHASDPAFRRRFEREARAAASLTHPNVVAVFDRGEEGGAPFIVMERVDGPSLADVVRRRHPDTGRGGLEPRQAAVIARQVAAALGAAHRIGLVHRDVKPSNVLLTRDGQPKVADFGIARVALDTTLTGDGQVLGSVPYVAPEQVAGGQVTAATDVYALGCVLHALLTGSPPFTGDDQVAILHQHANAPPPRLDDRDLPPGLGDVVARALAKDPLDRYRDGTTFAAALGAVLGERDDAGTTRVLPVAHDLEPTRVVADGAPPTDPTDPADPATGAPRRRWVRRAALLLLLVGALAAAAGLAPDEPADAPTGPEPAAPAAPAPQPEPEPEPQPEPPAEREPATVDDLLDELDGLLAADRSGEINPGAARKLSDKLEKVVEGYDDGEPGEALDKLTELRREIVDRAGSGQLTSPHARELLGVVTRLEQALLAATVADGDERGGDGEDGEGEGRGDRDD